MTKSPGVMAVMDAKAAGIICYWGLNGNVDAAKLRDVWEANKLPADLLPKPPSAHTALGRGCAEMASRRRLVRSLQGNKGWAIVDETPATGTLTYAVQTTAAITDGKLVVDPPTGQLADEIRAHFGAYQGVYTITDMSALLVAFVKSLKAVPLRTTGGVYFVPQENVAWVRLAAETLGQVSDHTIFEIPAMKSAEAMQAILAALVTEADTETSALETKFDTIDLGGRALKSRVARCQAMLEKVKTYEELLSTALPEVTGRVLSLKDTLMTAALTKVEGDE